VLQLLVRLRQVRHDVGRRRVPDRRAGPAARLPVLVVAEGFKPTFLEKVDPAAGPVRAKLA
jgi:hypothetical protein